MPAEGIHSKEGVGRRRRGWWWPVGLGERRTGGRGGLAEEEGGRGGRAGEEGGLAWRARGF